MIVKTLSNYSAEVLLCGGWWQGAVAGGRERRQVAWCVGGRQGAWDKGLAVGDVGERSCPLKKRKRTIGISPYCSFLVELKVLSLS